MTVPVFTLQTCPVCSVLNFSFQPDCTKLIISDSDFSHICFSLPWDMPVQATQHQCRKHTKNWERWGDMDYGTSVETALTIHVYYFHCLCLALFFSLVTKRTQMSQRLSSKVLERLLSPLHLCKAPNAK